MKEIDSKNAGPSGINDSAGAAYLDRVHQRSFSLNVFQMNAVELIEATHRVKDPDQGMSLMMEKNREAGRQAHRELNRHVHNFVSSALTLVEHTRVFMRRHYAGTELLESYEKQVVLSFAQSPVAQFVQGLRNYMLHRGLPDSSMYLKFTSHPSVADGSGTMETGVHYDTASLLDWRDWRPAARAYLEQAGEDIDVHDFAQEYLSLVSHFHGWLDAELAEHHARDLQELSALRAQLQINTPSGCSVVRPVEWTHISSPPFEFTSSHAADLTRKSIDLVRRIRELHFKQKAPGFSSDRVAVSISHSELRAPIQFWGPEIDGGMALTFIQHEDKSYGLGESDYDFLDDLISDVIRADWARDKLSRKFIEKAFCDWARVRFVSDEVSFPDALCAAARESVATLEVWAPIANMEVESPFVFGPVRLEPVTAPVFESFRRRAHTPRSEHEHKVNQLFERLRGQVQGFAAIVIVMEAEAKLAEELSLRIAQDAIGLLRFFSPAASISSLFSPVSLRGADHIPTSQLIMLREGGFRLSESVLPRHVGHWRVSSQQMSELDPRLLSAAASLVIPHGLSDFGLSVRESLLTFSKGITQVDPLDRLRSTILALEGILIKHEIEPRAHSIANRMALLLARRSEDRETIQRTVRQIYWLQELPKVTAQSRRQEELIAVFTLYAYSALSTVLYNVRKFGSKTEFVQELDTFDTSGR